MAFSRLLRGLLGRADAEPDPHPVPDDTDEVPPVADLAPKYARDEALVASIVSEPTDPTRWLVYADWLMGQGDPRGELGTLQYTLAHTTDPGQLMELRRREKELLARHRRHFLGPLAHFPNMAEVRWHLGHLRSVRLSMPEVWGNDPDYASVESLLQQLLEHPTGELLAEIVVGLCEDNDFSEAVRLIASEPRPLLRKLFVGDFEYPDECEISWANLGDLSPLWPALPGLEQLVLQGGGAELGEIDLPELRSFEIRTGGLPQDAVLSIAAAKWPKLERLVVWFGDSGYGAGGSLPDILPLLEGRGVPQLKHLGLMNCEFTDAIVERLVDSPVLAQLESLDLSMGTLSDAGGAAMLRRPEAFAHLRRLELTNSYLGTTARQLQAWGAFVHIGQQYPAGGEVRYVSVGE